MVGAGTGFQVLIQLGFGDDKVCSKSPGYSGRDCLYKDREELLEHTLMVCNV